MRFFVYIFGAIIALIPVAIMAAAPSSVTGLQIEFRDDETVAVSWEKLDEENIAYYRVYYSSESILKNQGSYDDFEQTDGPKGLFVFRGLAPDTDFYVSVLAVNTEGEESEFFAEEAFMHMPATTDDIPDLIPEPANAPVLQIPTGDEPLVDEAPSGAQTGESANIGHFQLMSVISVSPTEISVEFSQPLPDSAKPVFTVSKPDGSELEVLEVNVNGINVSLKTAAQEDTVYELVVGEMLMSSLGSSIDPDNRSVLFVGHAAVIVPTDEPAPAEVVEDIKDIDLGEFASDVVGLNMRAIRTPNGLYDAITVWDLDSLPENISHYIVGQSLDRGKTFIGPTLVPSDITELRTSGIKSGHFGIMMQIADQDGAVSPGVFVTIDLSTMKVDTWSPDLASLIGGPEDKPVPPPPVADEGPKVEIEDRPDSLPSSGTAFVLMTLMFSGAIAGRKVASRKK